MGSNSTLKKQTKRLQKETKKLRKERKKLQRTIKNATKQLGTVAIIPFGVSRDSSPRGRGCCDNNARQVVKNTKSAAKLEAREIEKTRKAVEKNSGNLGRMEQEARAHRIESEKNHVLRPQDE